ALPEAVISSVLLALLPRALFHAGLACFDAPIMTFWFGAIYAYWRCLDGRKWPWTAGVAFGLALATKHTALLLPFAFALHYVIATWKGWRGWLAHWRVIVSLVVLGPLTLLVLSLAASMGPFLAGSTPIFGAEKHWMPALPTICIAAGVGIAWAARKAVEVVRVKERIALAVVGGAVALAALTEVWVAEPYA